jgi:hypothetical protein
VVTPGSDQFLDEAAVSAGDLRSACVTLAGLALRAAGGDREAAGVMLRPVLEAIGAAAYEPGPGKYRYGAAS